MYYLKKLRDPQTGKRRYEIWLKQAEYDIAAAYESFKNGFYEWTSYQAQQAVEKSMKAVIIHGGYIPPKVHKLSILIGYCNNVNPHFKSTKFDFRHLDSFTFVSRYPFLIPGQHLTPHEQIKKSDAENLIEQASEFVKKVKFILDKDTAYDERISEAYEYKSQKINLSRRIENVRNNILRVYEPEKIILFGKYARDPYTQEESTLDVLIVTQTDEPFFDRIKKVREATKGGYPTVEPLVYTPQEYKYMIEEEGEGFLETAIEEGKVIYDSKEGIQ